MIQTGSCWALFGMHYKRKKKNITHILLLHLRNPQVYKEDGRSFSLSSPGFCFGALICLFRSQRMSLCVPAGALLLIPAHLGNHPQLLFLSLSPFSLKPSSSASSSPPNTYPTLSAPSCPLARSEVETCVSLHLHGGERKKSEVRSLASPPCRGGSRQTGAVHETFINPRQRAESLLNGPHCGAKFLL